MAHTKSSTASKVEDKKMVSLIDTDELEQKRTQQLERLIRRMAGLLKEYQVPEYDYEAKSIIEEVNEVALQ